MSLNAGSVYAVLGGRFVPSGFAQFDAAMKKAAANAGATEKAIVGSHKRSGDSMSAMGKVANKTAAVGIAAVGASMVFSVKKAMDFEKQMSAVQAATKANARDMRTMGDAAKRLGAQTGVGATVAAQAMEELGKGGMTAKQAVSALDATISMAQAGPMDLADAANTVVQSLATFNLTAKDSQMVADGLASAAAKTTMDVADFAQALAQGGTVAQSAGFSFDETMNIFGAMANRFKSGSDMGTSLKTAIQHLAAPTKKAKEEMERLNIDLFDNHGKAKKAADVVKMLGDRFGEMTPKQRIASAALIAGSDSMRTLLNLSTAAPKKIREQGSAAEMAGAKMDNLAGDWKKFTANLETAGIDIGSKFLPKLRDLSQGLTDFVQDIQKDKPDGGFTEFVKKVGTALKDASQFSWDFLKEGAKAAHEMGGTQLPEMKITAKFADEATPALERLQSKKLAPKVLKIMAEEGNAKSKIDALIKLKVPPKVARLVVQTGSADAAIAEITRQLAGIKRPPTIVVRVKDEASRILNNIINKPLRDKVAKILADDSSVQEKVAALQALGISGPTANFLANTAGITDARSAILGTKYTVPVKYVPEVLKPTLPGGLSTTYTVRPVVQPPGKGNASGRGPGAREASLVGEGGGPEWVGNPRDGWSLAHGPQIVGLRAEDYVIPTEQRYRGRAVQFMADALGIPGFKKGKKGTFKGKGKKRRYIPGPYERFVASPDDLKADADHAEQRYDGLRQDAREKKDGKLTKKAKRAKGQLGAAHDRMLRAKALYKQANEYAARITRMEDLIEIDRSDMTKADQADNQAAYDAAKKTRGEHIKRDIDLLRNALTKAPKGSKWRRELLKRLRQAEVDLGDNKTEAMDVETPDTFTQAQQDQLDRIDADIAKAALTATHDDDVKFLGEKLGFLEPLLSAADSAGRSTAVSEIAGMISSTRDALTEAQKPPDVTADQQLQTDQAFKRGLAQGQSATINRTIDRAFAGPAVVINTLHPGSPEVARALGDAAAAGFGYQRPKAAPTVRVGV